MLRNKPIGHYPKNELKVYIFNKDHQTIQPVSLTDDVWKGLLLLKIKSNTLYLTP